MTTDKTAPTLTSSPKPGASGVSRHANLSIRFSEAVGGVTSSTIRLRDAVTGKYITASVAYDGARKQAILNPGITLKGSHRYTVVVAAGMSDRAGNPLGTTSWTFRTGT